MREKDFFVNLLKDGSEIEEMMKRMEELGEDSYDEIIGEIPAAATISDINNIRRKQNDRKQQQ